MKLVRRFALVPVFHMVGTVYDKSEELEYLSFAWMRSPVAFEGDFRQEPVCFDWLVYTGHIPFLTGGSDIHKQSISYWFPQTPH
jgi:hypothetical protein